MRICPICGNDQFIVHAHVVQKWLVDKAGLCENVVSDCVCVTHEPDDEDIWQCSACGYENAGKKFYVEDNLIIEER